MILGKGVKMDLPKLIDSKLLIQANSGGGKSWLIRRILEQTHGKVQQIILDPEGEFGTLREKYDYILAGKGGDTPADPKSAAMLAKRLLELKVSAIIDLYELHPQDRKRFVRLFLEAMVNAPKPRFLPREASPMTAFAASLSPFSGTNVCASSITIRTGCHSSFGAFTIASKKSRTNLFLS